MGETRMPVPPPECRALVVDDDEGVRRLVQLLLSRRGWDVASAASGEEARATLARQKTFELVLVDYQLPGIDGVAVAREARRLTPAARVVLMSSATPPGKVAEELRALSVEFLAKPFEIQAIHRLASESMLRLHR